MIYQYRVKSNQFVLMAPPCKAWQVLVDSVSGLKRNDYIEVVELDSQFIETGNRLIGRVRWVTSGDMVINNNSSTLAYTIQIQILPIMRTVMFTFNLDSDGTFNTTKLVYNTTGVSWALNKTGDGNFEIVPDTSFTFQFKTYNISTPNQQLDGVFFDDTAASPTTTFKTFKGDGSIDNVNMYGGWVRIDFYV